jgi:hypothetical protein
MGNQIRFCNGWALKFSVSESQLFRGTTMYFMNNKIVGSRRPHHDNIYKSQWQLNCLARPLVFMLDPPIFYRRNALCT